MTSIGDPSGRLRDKPLFENRFVAVAFGTVLGVVICTAISESPLLTQKSSTTGEFAESGSAAALAAFVNTVPVTNALGSVIELPPGPTQPTGDRNTDNLLRCNSLLHGELNGFIKGRDTSRPEQPERFVAGAIVVLRISDRAGGEPPRYRSWTRTNEFGAFFFTNVPTGAYHIIVAYPKARGLFWPSDGNSKDGYYDADQPRCVTPNEIHYLDLVS